MSDDLRPRRVRLTPVLMTALFALASLKAAGLWISFAAAGAEEVATPTPVAVLKPSSPASETQERLLNQLAARNDELNSRESTLDTREQVIAAAELRLEAAIEGLRKEKDAIALAETDRARERRDEIGVLSSAYEKMKARDAARIFEVLDDDILLPVAAGMRTQSLAGVLAEMTPEKAKALTTALADRGADARPATPPTGATHVRPAEADAAQSETP